MNEDRITRLEEAIAHQSALVEELNEVVTNQAAEIDQLNRRVSMLMQRAAEQEADNLSGAPLADQRPPHW
ncbi:SlyX protein [Rhodobacterales bacterium 52_120_T64]|nr:SlyX protein [Rhodobacterales bacterium 52_120_T64]